MKSEVHQQDTACIGNSGGRRECFLSCEGSELLNFAGKASGNTSNVEELAHSALILVNRERDTGIEPVFQAWEARVEPIN